MTMADDTSATPALIVGGGPVGLALAAELGWRGIDCMLIEQTDGGIDTPKMNEVNVRSMEFCRRWGIADTVRDCPFPWDYSMDVAFMTRLGVELGRQKRPSKRDQKPGPMSPETFQICSQLWFDPILRRHVETLPSVTLAYHHRLEEFSQNADGVTAQITDLTTGIRETLSADYLVACDGANSAIRDACGIDVGGDKILGRPVHLYFKAPDFAEQLGFERAVFILLIDEQGAWANVRAIDPAQGLWRLMVIDTPENFDRENIDKDAQLRRATGRDDINVEWAGVSVWTRRGVVASRYRDKRVFLAGDAAHQVSPTGALGMNTGLGDAVDLGWKLAANIEGWGGDGLLDSYDIERRAVGARNVAMTTGFHQDHGGFQAPPAIDDTTPEAVAARKALGEKAVQIIGAMFRTDGLQLGYVYEGSPVCVPDGSPAPDDTSETYIQTARPGARAPHFWLEDGRSTLDMFGRGFVLLRLGDNPPDPSAMAEAAESKAIPLRIERITDPQISALYETRLVLVRPDGHVAWRGNEMPKDCGRILTQVAGTR